MCILLLLTINWSGKVNTVEPCLPNVFLFKQSVVEQKFEPQLAYHNLVAEQSTENKLICTPVLCLRERLGMHSVVPALHILHEMLLCTSAGIRKGSLLL